LEEIIASALESLSVAVPQEISRVLRETCKTMKPVEAIHYLGGILWALRNQEKKTIPIEGKELT